MQDGGRSSESTLLLNSDRYPPKMASSAADPMGVHMQGGYYDRPQDPQRRAMYADASSDMDDDMDDDNGTEDENQQQQASRKATKKRRSAVDKRRQWSPDDDLAILQFVRECGTKRWSKIQELLPGRTPKQCRTRYRTVLYPALKSTAVGMDIYLFAPFSILQVAQLPGPVDRQGPMARGRDAAHLRGPGATREQVG